MTYIEDKDPNSSRWYTIEAYTEMFDDEFPDWRERELDPEDRRFVSESDIRQDDYVAL